MSVVSCGLAHTPPENMNALVAAMKIICLPCIDFLLFCHALPTRPEGQEGQSEPRINGAKSGMRHGAGVYSSRHPLQQRCLAIARPSNISFPFVAGVLERA